MTKLTYNVDGFNIIEEVREITPQEASEILATKNVKNRKTNKNHVNALALNMTNGTWRYNADPIRFDANDVLIDGQHRLFAVVMAQKPILFKIVRGLDPEAFKVIDMEAKSRNLADLFKIDGIPHYTGIASIIGRYYLLNQGRTAMSNQTADGLHGGGKAQSFTTIEQRYDFFYQNRYVVEDAAVFSKKLYDASALLSMAEIGGIFLYLYITKHHSEAEIKNFFEGLFYTTDFNAINVLRNKLIMDRGAIKKMTASHKQSLVAKAWNCYITGEDVQVLPYSPATEGTIEFI